MKAKEMFEKIRYKEIERSDNFVRYESQPTMIGDCVFYIEIWKREELDDVLIRKATTQEQICNIWGYELQAINKQCEELGWLGE